MKRIRLALLGAVVASQAGCALGPAPLMERMTPDETAFGAPDITTEVPLARLPEAAGHIVAVQTDRNGGTLKQRIVLHGDGATAGENTIEVETMPALPFAVAPARPLREEQLASELETRFPGVAMRFAAQPEMSDAGPLGIAAGRAGAATCVYAWRNPRPTLSAETMTVRVRLCRAMGLDRLLALVGGLEVGGVTALDAAPPVTAALDLLSSILVPRRPVETLEAGSSEADPPPAADTVLVPRRHGHRTTTARVRPVPVRLVRRRLPAATDRAIDARGITIPLPGPASVAAATPARRPDSLADLPLPPP